jgi:biotin transport system substrate-specific component
MSTVTISRTRTLCDAVLNQRVTKHAWLYDGVLIVLFSALIAISARIAIPLPFTEVPLTGQTLAVLLTGGVLGSRRGALALLLYLLEGAVGLPVFAPSAALPPGVGRLLGPTGGYLLAFPVVAGAVGLLAERGWDRRFRSAVLAMLVGNLLIYLVAVPWLARFTDNLWLALLKGMLPFLPGDLIKIVLAAVALPGGWALVRREHEGS